jgi:hypothetical protein
VDERERDRDLDLERERDDELRLDRDRDRFLLNGAGVLLSGERERPCRTGIDCDSILGAEETCGLIAIEAWPCAWPIGRGSLDLDLETDLERDLDLLRFSSGYLERGPPTPLPLPLV